MAHDKADQPHDFPRAIGAPATRALLGAGFTRLAEVAKADDDQLLALHGFGPRALRILREHGVGQQG